MISIVVPCFNCEGTLERCCESILRQTEKSFELILVDDGSQDNTGIMCDRYADENAQVRVIHQENKGLMAAWKRGVEQAAGDYILFSDSDDWIEDSLVERVEEVVQRCHADIITYGIMVDYDNGRSISMNHRLKEGLYSKEAIEKKIIPYYFSTGGMETQKIIASRCSKAYKKELLVSNYDFCDERISVGEDDLTSFAAIMDAASLFHIADYAPYHYCRQKGSMMGNYGMGTINKLIDAYNGLKGIASKKYYPYNQQIDAYFIDNALIILKKIICSKKKSYDEIVHELRDILQLDVVKNVLLKDKVIVKKYKVKEKVFFYLVKRKRFHSLYFLTKFMSDFVD